MIKPTSESDPRQIDNDAKPQIEEQETQGKRKPIRAKIRKDNLQKIIENTMREMNSGTSSERGKSNKILSMADGRLMSDKEYFGRTRNSGYEKYNIRNFIWPRNLNIEWFRRMNLFQGIFLFVLGLLSSMSGILTMLFCSSTYFTNNGVACGAVTIICVVSNVVLVYGCHLETRVVTGMFIGCNAISLLVGGIGALVASIVGILCEVKGIGDGEFMEYGGSMKYNATGNFLIDRCPSAYFGVDNCDGESANNGRMNVIYYMAQRQHFIFLHLLLGICAMLIMIANAYLITKGTAFFRSMVPAAKGNANTRTGPMLSPQNETKPKNSEDVKIENEDVPVLDNDRAGGGQETAKKTNMPKVHNRLNYSSDSIGIPPPIGDTKVQTKKRELRESNRTSIEPVRSEKVDNSEKQEIFTPKSTQRSSGDGIEKQKRRKRSSRTRRSASRSSDRNSSRIRQGDLGKRSAEKTKTSSTLKSPQEEPTYYPSVKIQDRQEGGTDPGSIKETESNTLICVSSKPRVDGCKPVVIQFDDSSDLADLGWSTDASESSMPSMDTSPSESPVLPRNQIATSLSSTDESTKLVIDQILNSLNTASALFDPLGPSFQSNSGTNSPVTVIETIPNSPTFPPAPKSTPTNPDNLSPQAESWPDFDEVLAQQLANLSTEPKENESANHHEALVNFSSPEIMSPAWEKPTPSMAYHITDVTPPSHHQSDTEFHTSWNHTNTSPMQIPQNTRYVDPFKIDFDANGAGSDVNTLTERTQFDTSFGKDRRAGGASEVKESTSEASDTLARKENSSDSFYSMSPKTHSYCWDDEEFI